MVKLDTHKVDHIKKNLKEGIRTLKDLEKCNCKECKYVIELQNGTWLKLTEKEIERIKALEKDLEKIYDDIVKRVTLSNEYTDEQIDNRAEYGTPLYYLSNAVMEIENLQGFGIIELKKIENMEND